MVQQPWDHCCSLVRFSDFLNLHFYFFNLIPDSNKLVRCNTKEPAYIIVRLPQQHVSEELIINETGDLKAEKETRKSFVSCFSYLTFKVPLELFNSEIIYGQAFLLGWNKLELVSKIPQCSSKKLSKEEYPFTLEELFAFQAKNKDKWDNFFFASDLTDKEGNPRPLPISFLESPRKMLLAFAPQELGDKFNVKFSNPNGKERSYLKNGTADEEALYEVWNRDIWYGFDGTDDVTKPNTKVVGYASSFGPDKDIKLQPNPLQRSLLADLTNYKPDNDEKLSARNFIYNRLNTGAYGASYKAKYFNADHRGDLIVGATHETSQGRDTLSIITSRAIDANSGLKLYISTVAERTHKYNTSYMQKRYLVEYVEKEITYEREENSPFHPFKKIIALDSKKYYYPHHFKSDKPDEEDSQAYAVLKEEFKKEGGDVDYSDNLLKFRYLGIDHDNEKHPFEMDMLFIPEMVIKISCGTYTYKDSTGTCTYEKDKYVDIKHQGLLEPDSKLYSFDIKEFGDGWEEDDKWELKSLNIINKKRAENYEKHAVHVEKKIRMAPEPSSRKSQAEVENINDDNASIKTDSILFYSIFSGKDTPSFKKITPIMPKMAHAEAYIPQLEGIEQHPGTHYLGYSGKEGNEFVRILNLSDDYLKNHFSTINYNDISIDPYFDELSLRTDIVTNTSSNLLNSDSLVNLDLQIQGISFGENALISDEAIISQDAKVVQNDTAFDPKKIFGKAEILGFDLSQLFYEILKEQLPVTTSIVSKIEDLEKDVKEVLSSIRNHQEIIYAWKESIKNTEGKLEDAIKDLKVLKEELRNNVPEVDLSRAEKYIRFIEQHLEASISKEINFDDLYGDFFRENIYEELLYANLPRLKINVKESYENVWDGFQPKLKDIAENKEKNFAKYQFAKKQLKTAIQEVIQKPENFFISSKSVSQTYTPHEIELLLKFIFFKIFYDKIYHGQLKDLLSDIDDILRDIESELKGAEKKNCEAVIFIFNEIYLKSEVYLEGVAKNAKEKFEAIKDLLEGKVSQYTPYAEISYLNHHFRNFYNELDATKFFKDALKTFGATEKHIKNKVTNLKDKLKSEEEALVSKLKDYAKERINASGIEDEDREKFIEVYNKIRTADDRVLSNAKQFRSKFKKIISKQSEKHFNSRVLDLRDAISNKQKDIDDLENKIRNSIDLLSKAIVDHFDDLTNEEIIELKRIHDIIRSPRRQRIEYSFEHDDLQSIDAGIAKLVVNDKSRLRINSTIDILFKNELPLTIEKKDIQLRNEVENVGINFLDSLQINFKNISYQNGTQIPEDFQIRVDNIEFDGVFRFIAAFDEYLKDFGGNNLLLDIDSQGANIGFKYPLPSLTFGYFNLFNLKLNVFFHLPFETGKPLEVLFGVNNPKDRFIVQVNGFPGTGYLLMTLDPKKGITKIAFLIEFSGHVSFNFGVANGHAYLKAGIYYLKKYDRVEIGAYVLCSGHFRIIGLFSSSLLFNLRLWVSGDKLVGRGVLKVSKRFSKFWKVSVSVSMKYETTFNHAVSNKLVDTKLLRNYSKKTEAALESLESFDVIDTNFREETIIHLGQEVFLILKIQAWDRQPPFAFLIYENGKRVMVESEVVYKDKKCGETYYQYAVMPKEPGTHQFKLEDSHNNEISCIKNIVVENKEIPDFWKSYFSSYYK